MNTDIHEVTDILYILIYTKKQIYTVATLPPPNGRLRNTRLPRPCWTAAARSSPQSQCAAAYNADRVFPAPQGIHPQNTGHSPGGGVVVLGGCVFFGFPKF